MDERLTRAYCSLQGLSTADALGGFFELGHPDRIPWMLKTRYLPSPEWRYTDDTNMALSIFSVLRQHQHIDQDALAKNFSVHFQRSRGYGWSTRTLLMTLQFPTIWREMSKTTFGGDGSFGNGGAMRVAPLGAYFADDLEAAIKNAALSAEITHAHPEGIAGAIAVAVAAAIAWQVRDQRPTRPEFIQLVLPHVPESEVRTNIEQARDLPAGLSIQEVTDQIGNGSRISAQDTVPFVLYCAGEFLDNYEEAIWQTLSGGGDADTTAAMVGGIIAMYTGEAAIPSEWLKRREPLPKWIFEE